MSKLNIDQKCIKDLFIDKKADFLIPDYQRPYAWGEVECQTLWDDIFSFAFPDDDFSKFNSDSDEYYLGSIVTFNNANSKKEIIDGQQRLITLMLLLRAFYSKFGNMKDENSRNTMATIAKCIWKTNEFGQPCFSTLKIDSDVASDEYKKELLYILRDDIATDDMKSRYAQNYRFFKEKIRKFLDEYPSYFAYLPIRILNNCILLPIEAESQDTALRIFSTLNDRGKPLSDADIFKADFYKFYSSIGKKDDFIKRWKYLETICEENFKTNSGSPLDEIFTRYMYYERAKRGIKSSTTEALRKFYKQICPELLKKEETFDNLISLAEFWVSVGKQDDAAFSDETLRKLFVLNYSPNGMWVYFLSVYFMQYRDADGKLKESALNTFLDKMTAFTFAYALTNPGVNALRTPIYSEMINVVNGQEVTYKDFLFEEDRVSLSIKNFAFYNQRPITKSLLTWWALRNDKQPLLDLDIRFEIEHIYPKNRYENEKGLSSDTILESLGNKALLEKRINIRASDYRLVDKKKYYNGFTNARGKVKEGTKIVELLDIAKKGDYLESDIAEREELIFKTFIDYLKENGLVKPAQPETQE